MQKLKRSNGKRCWPRCQKTCATFFATRNCWMASGAATYFICCRSICEYGNCGLADTFTVVRSRRIVREDS